MCNTYATPVTRATVDEFRPGFSAFGVPPPSMYIPACQNPAFPYILFCGIPIALPGNSPRFLHPLVAWASRLYIHSISNLFPRNFRGVASDAPLRGSSLPSTGGPNLTSFRRPPGRNSYVKAIPHALGRGLRSCSGDLSPKD